MEQQNNSNNSVPIKDYLRNIDSKLDKLLESQQQLAIQVATHIAQPGHSVGVEALEDHEARIIIIERWKDRRDGNLDVVKYFFGASIASLLLSMAQLIMKLSETR